MRLRRDPERALERKRDATNKGRLLAIGLAMILLCLAAFALWGAYSTNKASGRAMQMSALGTAYDEAHRAGRDERNLELRYLRHPSHETAADFNNASATLVNTLGVAFRAGLSQDQTIVRLALQRQREYTDAVVEGFDLADEGRSPIVSDASTRAFSRLMRDIQFRAEAALRCRVLAPNWLRRTELFVLVATPLAFAGGLVLLAVFTVLLLRLIRQTKEAQEAEVHRLQEVADRLQALDDMKNAFLQAVSHELRTPLTSILGFSLTLQRAEHGALDLAPGDREDLLDRLASNAKRLQGLLSELLDLDRVARGLLEPRRQLVDVAVLVNDVVDIVEHEGRRIQVHARPTVVAVDGPKVERIVENLVANAVKYTQSASPIMVLVQPYEEGVLIAVEDEGPGVPDPLKQEVFQPFRQGPNRSSHSPGTGIGLSLVARFAELHGGRAWVEDRPGGGSSFRVYLPDGPEDTPDTEQDMTPVDPAVAQLAAAELANVQAAVTESSLGDDVGRSNGNGSNGHGSNGHLVPASLSPYEAPPAPVG